MSNTFHRASRWAVVCAAVLALPLLAPVAAYADNGPAPGEGPYMVFAHYMPCFKAYGIRKGDNYWFSDAFMPHPGAKGGDTTRPIVYPLDDKDPEFDAVVSDIRLAKSYGIDGFLVDELDDNTMYDQEWDRLLKAADLVGGFKIGIMPDYATLGSPSLHLATTRVKIKDWVDRGAGHPSLLRYDGKPVVFPYGDGYPDGYYKDLNEAVPVAEKKDLVDWLAAQGDPISYAPSFGINWPMIRAPYDHDPATGFQTYSFAEGSFSPMAPEHFFDEALDYWPKSLMVMGENSFIYYNRGWHYSTAHAELSEHYRTHWEWNIAHRDRVRWIMIVTWNDWGETAIAPSVNHFMAWQPITKYYADWFKTGKQPAISDDSIEIFHRPHPLAATGTVDQFDVTKAPGFQLVAPNDTVEALAFLKAPATLVIHSGDSYSRKDVPAGVQSLVRPFSLGVQSASIERNGKTIAYVVSPVPITASPARQNLWYIGADSGHPPREIAADRWIDVTGTWTGASGARKGSGLTVAGDPMQLGDCTIEATLVKAPQADGSRAGLVAHATDDGATYYSMTIGSVAGRPVWQIAKTVNGVQTVLSSGDLTGSADSPHTLRFDCVGEYRIGYIDGKLLAELSDYPHGDDYELTFGHGGVTAIGETADFTNISLRSYDPDLAALRSPSRF